MKFERINQTKRDFPVNKRIVKKETIKNVRGEKKGEDLVGSMCQCSQHPRHTQLIKFSALPKFTGFGKATLLH